MNTQTKSITIRRDVNLESKADAEKERQRLSDRGTLVVNLLSSPGSGKTTLLEATARNLSRSHTMAVLVGDLETDRDAERLRPLVPTAQLTTGGACHLELPLVHRGLQAIGDPEVDFLFIVVVLGTPLTELFHSIQANWVLIRRVVRDGFQTGRIRCLVEESSR